MNHNDKCAVADGTDASVIFGTGAHDGFKLSGHWDVVCHGPDGKEKWRTIIENVVTTVGKNDFLDKYLKGAAYTQTFRAGLKGAGAAVVGDTQASHASWSEQGLANAPTYTGNRKDVVMGAASGGASVSPAQVFAITSTGTVAGLFTNNGGSATKDDTSGILFSAGDFATGNRAVLNGDTISATYTLTLT